MDYEASLRVKHLISSLTDFKSSSLDDSKLRDLKALLKQHNELVAYATPLLLDRLAANHSQARKLCVDLCAVLFSRSRAFRQLLTQQFTTFVDLTVGHRSDQPLPAPPAAAVALRGRALEVIEEWHEAWGTHYPQVTVAYRYLKKQYKFPEIASSAAAVAAAAAARLQRHQQLLLQRYQAFKGDFPEQRVQLDSLAQQMQECFNLLAEQPQPAQPHPAYDDDDRTNSHHQPPTPPEPVNTAGQQDGSHNTTPVNDGAASSAATAAAGAAGCVGEEWEDVPAAAAAAVDAVRACGEAASAAGPAVGGVCELDVDEWVGDYPEPNSTAGVAEVEAAARNVSLLDNLTDLTRQASRATTHPLLDWLRLLTQVNMQQPQQQQQQVAARLAEQQRQYERWQQERQTFLREVVRLRAQLQALIEEASSTWGVSLPPPTATTPASHAAAAAAAASPSLPQAAAAAADGAVPPMVTSVHQSTSQAGEHQPPPDLSALPTRVNNNSSSNHTARGVGFEPQQQQQQAVMCGNSRTGHQLILGDNLRRLQQQQQQQQSLCVRSGVADVYAGLRDPTIAVGSYTIPQEVISRNEQLKFFHSPPDMAPTLEEGAAAAPSTAAAASAGGGSGPDQGSSQGVKAEVFKRLLSSAPQLPISGQDWLLAEYSVTQHGMELYNHWGAVDASVGPPKDRLGQLTGYAASYFVPKQQSSHKPHPAAAAAAAAGVTSGPTSQPRRSDDAQQHTPGSNDSTPMAAGQRSAAVGSANAVGPAAAAAVTVADEPQPQPQPQQQVQMPPLVIGQRDAAAAHNRAVLSGAFTDEGMAAALQRQLDQEAAAERSAGKQGRARKAPERKADKIRRKLLG